VVAQTQQAIRNNNNNNNGDEVDSATPPSRFQPLRNLAYLLYGGLYQGCAQHFLYNVCFPVWFGDNKNILTVLKKVSFDLLVLTPTLCLPTAYLTKALIFRYSLQEGLKRYIHDVKNNGLLKKYSLMWGPVHCLTFGVIPAHLRIVFIAAFSFVWLIVLSSLTSKSDANREAKLAGEVAVEGATPTNTVSM
jgi:protein Mpv17